MGLSVPRSSFCWLNAYILAELYITFIIIAIKKIKKIIYICKFSIEFYNHITISIFFSVIFLIRLRIYAFLFYQYIVRLNPNIWTNEKPGPQKKKIIDTHCCKFTTNR